MAEPHPSEVEAKIKGLLKETAAAMAGPGPYVKLASLAAQVKTGQGLGTVLKTLRSKKDSKSVDEAAEAQMMFDALNSAAQSRLVKALEEKNSDPCLAVKHLDKLAQDFGGDEIGIKARTECDAFKKDPKVKKEIEAQGYFNQLQAIHDGMKPFQGGKNQKAEGFRKLNNTAIQSLVLGCQTLVQRYADTIAAKKAQELMDQYR